MSRRRHRERYWAHSDPETPPGPVTNVADNGAPPPCPGACNTAYRKAEKRARDEADTAQREHRPPDADIVFHDARPAPGNPVWCLACQTRIQVAISRLPEFAALAGERRDGQLSVHAGVDAGLRHGKGSHSPSGSPAWDTVDEAITWADDTAHSLALHLGHSWRPRRRNDGTPYGAPDLTRASGYLATWSTALLRLPNATRYGRQALVLAERLNRAAGRDELVHHPVIACPKCNQRTLRRDDGSDSITCRRCRNTMTMDDYDALVDALRSRQTRKALR